MTDINELEDKFKIIDKSNTKISEEDILNKLDEIIHLSNEFDTWIEKEKARINQIKDSSKEDYENL